MIRSLTIKSTFQDEFFSTAVIIYSVLELAMNRISHASANGVFLQVCTYCVNVSNYVETHICSTKLAIVPPGESSQEGQRERPVTGINRINLVGVAVAEAEEEEVV